MSIASAARRPGVVGEVEQPAVVRAGTRGPQLVLCRFAEPAEGNAGIREQHLGDHALTLEHLGAQR